jgi:hypothetical protein
VTARAQLAARGGVHRAEMRETEFTSAELMGPRVPIAAVYNALAKSEPRNARIFDDVLTALEMRRHPLVLTERRDHLELLASRFVCGQGHRTTGRYVSTGTRYRLDHIARR